MTSHIKYFNFHEKSQKYHHKYVSKVKILEEINFVLNSLSINIVLEKKKNRLSRSFCLSLLTVQGEGTEVFCTILTMPSLMISGYSYAFNNSLNLHG